VCHRGRGLAWQVAYKLQTPGHHPKERIRHLEQGESLKSRTLNLLEELIAFLATCFDSYTEPSSGWTSEWFVYTIFGALKVTRSQSTNNSTYKRLQRLS
jgi:hypothetical protein